MKNILYYLLPDCCIDTPKHSPEYRYKSVNDLENITEDEYVNMPENIKEKDTTCITDTSCNDIAAHNIKKSKVNPGEGILVSNAVTLLCTLLQH